MIIANKLQKGDEIRVIAPSRSLSLLSDDTMTIALERLQSYGFHISFSKHCSEKDENMSSSIQSRVEDLHEAFLDTNVKGILTVIGGFNVNQILSYLDYDLIKQNPKILCGYSDITALSHAIYAKTGVITYAGPHFSTFGMKKGMEYTEEYFFKCLTEIKPFDVQPAQSWSDDLWFLDQNVREFNINDGYEIINEGEVVGTIIGGNLCTLNLLQGTPYMPSLQNSILFLEEDNLVGDFLNVEFDRNLQSLIHMDSFEGVKAIVIGRCQKECKMDSSKFKKIIASKKELQRLPVIYGADFGHTSPMFTYPIGGTAQLQAKDGKVTLSILKH